ncbi:IS110 family transposase [Pygmaiobacter massiliensis]|uniref:IS110 family transposase n=1 Tax=Pygmaiobacter massiliensis TaxID=1917873 RepID=UPI00289BFF05|nr:IS110 family transposase [Pygmaiobacter massiliensis]
MVCALREDGRLGRYQRKIHVLNPKQIKKFKDSYPDLPKNDWVDAFVIADHLRFGRIGKEVYMDDYRYRSLPTVTRARFDAVQSLTREKQRFANYLLLKCSGIAQDKDIANSSATTIALMERFETVDELSYADMDELTAFVAKSGRGRFADPEATAKAVQTAARGSYRLPKTVNDSVNQAMSVAIATMRALDGQIKVLDKAIEQQFQIIPNTLTSIPGIGKVYSAGIIAEIGDVRRFNSRASVAKYAGLVWTQYRSGDFEAQHTKLIKSGNRYLRYYLLEAANSVRRCDSEFRRYYDLKFKEVNQFQHKRALALTARKLVRLVYRLLMDNRLYIPPEG